MERFLKAALLEWADSVSRLPLLLRGARQVGKTYLVEHFAQSRFDHLVTMNLEKNPEYAQCFSTFSPSDILQKISAVLGTTIVPGKTLLFLDEIQACPRAIQALRYFKV